MPFDVPQQHACNQVPAQHKEGDDPDDTGTLKQARPGMAEEDSAYGSPAQDVQPIQPGRHLIFPGGLPGRCSDRSDCSTKQRQMTSTVLRLSFLQRRARFSPSVAPGTILPGPSE
jgi:hypothetical protein